MLVTHPFLIHETCLRLLEATAAARLGLYHQYLVEHSLEVTCFGVISLGGRAEEASWH